MASSHEANDFVKVPHRYKPINQDCTTTLYVVRICLMFLIKDVTSKMHLGCSSAVCLRLLFSKMERY
ncbi:unnamed protein product [Victoria cruziana]